jgi:outer membrane protein assembly factor BamB
MRVVSTVFVLLFLRPVVADWPQFRGPGGQGHADAKGLPTTWSETENVTWKIPVPGAGLSSPSISDGQIWLTTSVEDGHSLHALCFAVEDGNTLHNVPLFRLDDLPESHGKNGYASPSAVLDGDAVYVHFGTSGTACLSRQTGEVKWKNNELKYSQPYAGASSPILYKDLLILSCDGTDVQFVVALDKRTGKIAWKTPRAHLEETRKNPDSRWPGGIMLMAYSTPLVIDVDGVPQLVSPAAEHVAAYDVRNGKEIWWLGYSGFAEVARPIYAQGVLIILGFEEVAERTLFAIRPDGKGDVTGTHLLWKRRRSVPHVPSPLAIGEELFLINDGGVATCLDLKSGDEHWQARVGGNISASPVYADGKIYVCNEAGKTAVLAPGKKHELIASNQLDGSILASPAVAGRSLFLRSDTHLYRLEAAGDKP